MFEYVPIAFVFRHIASVAVLGSVLDRSPYGNLGNVQKPLRCIHGSCVLHLFFDEDYYTQQHLSLLLSLFLFILIFLAAVHCPYLQGHLGTYT